MVPSSWIHGRQKMSSRRVSKRFSTSKPQTQKEKGYVESADRVRTCRETSMDETRRFFYHHPMLCEVCTPRHHSTRPNPNDRQK